MCRREAVILKYLVNAYCNLKVKLNFSCNLKVKVKIFHTKHNEKPILLFLSQLLFKNYIYPTLPIFI